MEAALYAVYEGGQDLVLIHHDTGVQHVPQSFCVCKPFIVLPAGPEAA